MDGWRDLGPEQAATLMGIPARWMPHMIDGLACYFRGQTGAAFVARGPEFGWAWHDPLEAELARLRARYERTFGTPAPTLDRASLGDQCGDIAQALRNRPKGL